MPDQAFPSASVVIDGNTYCLRHLESSSLLVCTESRPKGARIHVSCSNHVYTEKFIDGHHRPELLIDECRQRRAFDQLRYDLSLGLPDMIANLPDAKVFGTPERNFYQLSRRVDGEDGEYRMFFNLKRSGVPERYDLRMFVESAYSPDPAKTTPTYRMQKVRFKLLVDKTLRGQTVNFKPKR